MTGSVLFPLIIVSFVPIWAAFIANARTSREQRATRD